jgi:hypothetical protein
LGDYTGTSAAWWRLAFLVLAFIGGIGFVLYLLMWLAIPREDLSRSAAGRAADHFPGAPAWLGIALLMIAAVLLAGELGVWTASVRWAFLLIAVGIILYVRDAERRGAPIPPAPPERPDDLGTPSTWPGAGTIRQDVSTEPKAITPTPVERSPLGWLTAGVALVVGGILWSLRGSGGPSTEDALAFPLLILGIGLLIGAFVGRTRWTILLGLPLIPLALIASLITLPLTGSWEDRYYQPKTAAAIHPSYQQAGGKMHLDLTNLAHYGAPIQARLAIGSIDVVVPRCAALDITASVGAGTVTVDGQSQGGLHLIRAIRVDSGSPLRMSLQVNIGAIDVLRVGPPDQGCVR